MVEKHIVSGFDKDLESIEALIMKMGGLLRRRSQMRPVHLKPVIIHWQKRLSRAIK